MTFEAKTLLLDVPILDEIWSLHEDVPLSLNKNKRWLIPDLIQQELFTYSHKGRTWPENHNEENPKDFQIVIRKTIVKNNNAVGILRWKQYCDIPWLNISDVSHYRKPRSYCQADNILNTAPLFSKVTRRKLCHRDWGIQPERNECIDPDQYRIEVFQPIDNPTTQLQVPLKTLGYDVRKHFQCRNYIRQPWRQIGYRFRRSYYKPKQKLINDFAVSVKYTATTTTPTEVESSENVITDEPKKHVTTLWDFIEKVLETRNTGSRKTATNVNKTENFEINSQTGELFNDVNREDGTEKEAIQTEKYDKSIQTLKEEISDRGFTIVCERFKYDSRFTSILIANDGVSPEYLSVKFGENYLECKCFPRRFLIDISEVLGYSGEITSKKQNAHLKSTVFLVFIHEIYSNENDTGNQCFYLTLNEYGKGALLKINTLKEGNVYSIEEVIKKSKDFVAEQVNSVLHSESENHTVKPSSQYFMLEELSKWSSMSYLPNDSFCLDLLFSRQVSESLGNRCLSRQSKHSSTSQILAQEPICEICLLKMEYTPGHTALTCCGHMFCNSCWEYYLSTAILTGAKSLSCLKTSCGEAVDVATLLSFVQLSLCLKFAKYLHFKEVETDPLRTWCSSVKCSRVVVRSSVSVDIVQCQCGERFCFGCSGIPHWPLSCQLFSDYNNKLIQGAKAIAPPDFIEKSYCAVCRLCLSVISTYDRCIIATCLSNRKLCRRCLTGWHGSLILPLNNELEHHNLDLTNHVCDQFIRSFFDNDLVFIKKLYKWESFAYQHRIQRHPFRLMKLKNFSRQVSRKIRNWLHPSHCNSLRLYIEIGGHEVGLETGNSEMFIHGVVDLYAEINNIVEHTAVMLDLDVSLGHKKAEIQYYVLKLSNNVKTLLSMFKEGTFLKTDRLLKGLKDVQTDTKQSLEILISIINKK